MTNTVKRGAGRPAAAARTTKHAQRNPQTGPRPAVAVAQQIADEAKAEPAATPYGKMTVPELKARLAELSGGKLPRGTSGMPKGDLMNLILQRERAQAAGTYDSGKRILRVEDDVQPATVAANETAPESKGAAKAAKLAVALEPYGWAQEAVFGDAEATDRCTVVLTRGNETITVVWYAGVYSYEQSVHMVADRTTRLRNVSAAVKLGSRPAEAVAAEYAKVISNKRFRPREPKPSDGATEGAVLGRLFPDPSAITQDDLFAALAGYRVVWINRITNVTDSAHVSQNFKFFKLGANPAGEPTVQFCTDQGFRACRVADIVGTSRRAGKARRNRSEAQAA